MMKVTLPFDTKDERVAAAEFLATLAREGVTFNAEIDGDELVVTFTGGY